jgi:hypothetical protein
MGNSPDVSTSALTHRQTSHLAHLHNILLRSSRLTGHQQLALQIAVLHLLDVHQPCTAAHIVVAIAGSCTPASAKLQQELAELTNHTQLLQQLTWLLALNCNRNPSSSSSTSGSSQNFHLQKCPSATIAILSCCNTLAAVTEDCQLLDWWQEEATESALLQCACSNRRAATLVASVASSIACRGLPARLLLRQLVLPAACRRRAPAADADAKAGVTAGSWVVRGLPPMLLQILLQLQKKQQQQKSLPLWAGSPMTSSSEEQLWLLLCSCIDAADAAAGLLPLQPLHDLCSSELFFGCLQAALLAAQQPQLHSAVMKMVLQLAGLSGQLAAICFKVMAPLMLQLMPLLTHEQQCKHATSNSAGTAVGACPHTASCSSPGRPLMLQTWQAVLTRTCSGDGRHHVIAWVGEQLPSITAAMATAALLASTQLGAASGTATTMAAAHSSTSQQPLEPSPAWTCNSSALDNYVAVFLPAAGSIACNTQPLLVKHQGCRLLVAAVAPHKPVLLQLIRNYAYVAVAHQVCPEPSTSPTQGDSKAALGGTCSMELLLLAVWLLHSVLAAELLEGPAAHQQGHQQQQTVNAGPMALNAAESSSDTAARAQCEHDESWKGVVVAIARWLAIENPTSLQLQLQASGLVLAKLLLALAARHHRPGETGTGKEVRQWIAAAEVRWPRDSVRSDVDPVVGGARGATGFSCSDAIVSIQQDSLMQWEWQQLLAALECALAGGATGDCKTVKRRQVLRLACEVVDSLAQQYPHLLLGKVCGKLQSTSGNVQCGSCSSSGSSNTCNSSTASRGLEGQRATHKLEAAMAGLGWTTAPPANQQLASGSGHQNEQQKMCCVRLLDDLESLRLRLLQLKLCRSCSGQELLDAVEEAMERLQALQRATLRQ